ncbi:MAG: DEAD/DEAH box helicase [Rikenellaceae bacterium]
MTFEKLKISEPVLKALIEEKYKTPTSIQIKAIPVALEGKDMFAIAQTGTGKTAAFAIPIIDRLSSIKTTPKKREIKALILTPTRELAIQIEESFATYAKYTPLKHTVIFGGVKQGAQVAKLRGGTDILIATPGRLLDFIGQGVINLKSITHFVLDEADRMLDMGFIHDIKRVLPLLPKKRQTLLFSATMPKEIIAISKSILTNPMRVEVTPESSIVDVINQHIYYVEKPQRAKLLIDIVSKHSDKSILIFSRTKHGADRLSKILNKSKIECSAIHGNKSQNSRQNTLSNFKKGALKVIVATDIAARGIDINDLGVVINYDLPDVAETYVHRIGRTGRAGKSGLAYSFCSKEERSMVKAIEKLTSNKITTEQITA